MERLKLLGAFILMTAVFLACSKEHDHAEEPHDHSHEEMTAVPEHDHADGDDAAHGQDAENTRDGDARRHDASAAPEDVHGSDEAEAGHSREQESDAPGTAGHVHDSEGMITVEGEWERLVGLETVEAAIMPMERQVAVPGQIIPDRNRVAVVSPFISASVNCMFAKIGDRVNEGDELVCLTSPEIGILRAEHDKSKAQLEIQISNFERRKKLFEDNIISEKVFQESELSLKLAEVNYRYALKRLMAIGITEAEVENPPTGHSDAVGSTIHIHSPLSGVITAWNVSRGQQVDASTQLFEIVDLERVWLEADVYEKDLSKIRIGQTVRARVTAYPGEVFSGRIFHIGNMLNAGTKTIKVLAEIPNAEQKLKPGMFARTSVVYGAKTRALVIPREAVLEDESLHIVFVKSGNAFHRHVVELGIMSDTHVEVVAGLEPGEQVVTKGGFQLKSKMKMQGVDPHAGHVH